MCEIGVRVMTRAGEVGIVIGHVGQPPGMAIVSLDPTDTINYGTCVTIPDNSGRPVNRQQRGRAVVIQPNGRASTLSRGDTSRVHVRSPK